MRTLNRYLFIAILLFITLAVNAVVGYTNIARLTRNEQMVANTFSVVASLEDIVSLTKDAETGQRSYALTGEARYLSPYTKAQDELQGAFLNLTELSADPQQKTLLSRLQKQVWQHMKTIQQGINLRKKSGLVAARKFIDKGQGKRESDGIRISVTDMTNREQELLLDRVAQSQASADDAMRTFWIGSISNIAFLALISYLLWMASKHSRQLRHAFSEVKRAEDMRDSLTAMLVHDLRTPLTSLLGPLQMLKTEMLGPLDETQREVVAISEQSGNRLLGLVNELLDVAKMEAGELKIHPEPVDTADLFHDAITFVDGLGLITGSPIKIEPSASHAMVLVDNELITRVLINLLGNALKFIPANGQITLRACHHNDSVCRIEISDTGPGIPLAEQGRIFEKFGQVESRRKGGKYSTGLGLTFCKLAVEAHGGQIWVESEPGQGSTFAFTLPATSQVPAKTSLVAVNGTHPS